MQIVTTFQTIAYNTCNAEIAEYAAHNMNSW